MTRLSFPIALMLLAPLRTDLGTVKVAVKAPFVVVMTDGVVTNASPLSESVTCSLAPKPFPVTVSVAPGAVDGLLMLIVGVSAATLIMVLAERLLLAPFAVTVYVPGLRLYGIVMPVAASMPLASALAVTMTPLIPLMERLTVSLGTKPLPLTITTPLRLVVLGVAVIIVLATASTARAVTGVVAALAAAGASANPLAAILPASSTASVLVVLMSADPFTYRDMTITPKWPGRGPRITSEARGRCWGFRPYISYITPRTWESPVNSIGVR